MLEADTLKNANRPPLACVLLHLTAGSVSGCGIILFDYCSRLVYLLLQKKSDVRHSIHLQRSFV